MIKLGLGIDGDDDEEEEKPLTHQPPVMRTICQNLKMVTMRTTPTEWKRSIKPLITKIRYCRLFKQKFHKLCVLLSVKCLLLLTDKMKKLKFRRRISGLL